MKWNCNDMQGKVNDMKMTWHEWLSECMKWNEMTWNEINSYGMKFKWYEIECIDEVEWN